MSVLTLAVQFLEIILQTKSHYGGVAQLGEHLPCKQGVMGSNPIISTSRIEPTPKKKGSMMVETEPVSENGL